MDQQETPIEIAINKEDLDVLKILANFTEVPNKTKHKQLRIMLDKEKKGSPSTEFCKLLESVPAEEVNLFLKFKFYTIFTKKLLQSVPAEEVKFPQLSRHC